MRMRSIRIAIIISLLLVIVISYSYARLKADGNKLASEDPRVWQSDIEQLVADDHLSPPVAGSHLFIGSSSIRLWESLADDMRPLTTINRGFGGAKIMDVSYYVSTVVEPYKPAATVVYIGSNDLSTLMGNQPKTYERMTRLYQQLVDRLKAAAPEADIFFIALRPVPSQKQRWAEYDAVNHYLQSLADEDNRVGYIDANPGMRLPNGEIDESLLAMDKIHLNAKGYAVWAETIRRQLLHHRDGSIE